jgi:choline dehydrogenase-like flavoprotein
VFVDGVDRGEHAMLMEAKTAGGDFDVIVVGSGAGGSAATYKLVKAGLKVALVEKGRPLPTDGSTLDVQTVVFDGAFKAKEEWRDRAGRKLVPEEYFNLGGKTKWYGAALARFRPVEFAAEAGSEYRAWPIGYDDLAPYYDEIEDLLGVRAFECEPDLAAIIRRLRASAPQWRAEPLPMGLAAEIALDANEAAHFDGFASARRLKADGEVKLLARVADAQNLTVFLGRGVDTLLGAPGCPERTAGVRLTDGTELKAKAVVLAAGAMHSPRILERYLSTAGLTHVRGADAVGRHFKLHLLTAVIAIAPRRQRDLIRKTTLLLDDRVPHSSVQALGFDAELIAALVPRYVPRALARALGERAYGFFLQTEDGSHPDNRIRSAGSAAPYPVVDYDAARIPAARAEHRRLVRLFRRDLFKAGYVNFAEPIGLHGTAHACGTLAAGDDPRTSAVDGAGRFHGLKGLVVADGSILPRVSRVNPALTIYAWSLRVAERLAGRLGGEAEPSEAVAAAAVEG